VTSLTSTSERKIKMPCTEHDVESNDSSDLYRLTGYERRKTNRKVQQNIKQAEFSKGRSPKQSQDPKKGTRKRKVQGNKA